tara:strand:- start:749 stop:1576 length:828 start_codon:yes stop_codon:yes gene_type:complete
MNIALQLKKLYSFARGRVSAKREARQLIRLQRNMQRIALRRVTSLFRKFINTKAFLYKEFGVYEPLQASRDLSEELFPVMLAHYKRVISAVYKHNADKYDRNTKAEEAIVFGRNVDIDELAAIYFANRQLILSNISTRMANRIDKIIREGRADNLTLQAIAAAISNKILPIGRNRAALIARTETHNAAMYANHAYHKKVKDDYGVKMLKQWVSAGDLRTRSAHAAANGQIVDMDEDFIVGGVPMAYAGDPKGGAKNVINCRCAIIYVDEEDVVLE